MAIASPNAISASASAYLKSREIDRSVSKDLASNLTGLLGLLN